MIQGRPGKIMNDTGQAGKTKNDTGQAGKTRNDLGQVVTKSGDLKKVDNIFAAERSFPAAFPYIFRMTESIPKEIL